MKALTWGTTVLVAMWPFLADAETGAAAPTTEQEANSALALELFTQREMERAMSVMPVLPYEYPVPGRFSLEGMDRQYRSDFYWLWSPEVRPWPPPPPIWQPAPLRPPITPRP